ncbi:MAG TPA: COQ9 family protein [Stellaceae bacterium]|nr:COQ9 family protein [Stellaceae bacterium]
MNDFAREDAFLEALLPEVPFEGWSRRAVETVSARLRIEGTSLFPHLPRDLLTAFSHWADRRAVAALLEGDAPMKTRERIAFGLKARLRFLEPHREATRRALAHLSLPHHLALGGRLLYDTVDALWYAAGDTATDYNFYTKRALLAAVQASTTLFWLDDRSSERRESEAFLERRLDDVMAIPRVTQRARLLLDHLPDPRYFWRAAR